MVGHFADFGAPVGWRVAWVGGGERIPRQIARVTYEMARQSQSLQRPMFIGKSAQRKSGIDNAHITRQKTAIQTQKSQVRSAAK